MKWCCSIFEDLVDCAGERGLAIIVATLKDDRFLLQFRAVEVGHALGYNEVPVAVEGHRVIFFCPGCGVNLAKFYKKSMDALRRQDLLPDAEWR
jgi:hypothetical protein